MCSLAGMHTMVMCATSQDSLMLKRFSGEVNTEINYGNNYQSRYRHKWDFPHITAIGDWDMGKGWSISVEFEYERFYEDGRWGNSFKENFSTNKLYIQKTLNHSISLTGGIIGVPVGLTNSRGTALTIYDPESEAALLPMTWHETGFALEGVYHNIRWMVGGLSYLALPLRESRILGATARVDYSISKDIHWGISTYCGSSIRGMVGFQHPSFVGTNGITYISTDAAYENHGIVATASFVYGSNHDAHSVGAEAGYDILHPFKPLQVFRLTPFIRYDGIFRTEFPAINKWTMGVNCSISDGLMVKLEYSIRRYCGFCTEKNMDVGLGYTWNF